MSTFAPPTQEQLIAAARVLWGQETSTSSGELRFGKHGSKSLNLVKLCYFDHEAGEGGGYVSLFRRAGMPLPNGEQCDQDREFAAIYPYRDENRTLLYQVLRKRHPKSASDRFTQRAPDPASLDGWRHGPNGKWTTKDIRRVLYRLPELLAADAAAPVFIPEGERDVESLCACGLVATTNAGGAGKWRKEYGEALRGRDAVVLPDNDQCGREHAEDVRRKLAGFAHSIVIVELPGLLEKGDISDWLANGGTVEQLVALVATARSHPPEPDDGTSAVILPHGFTIDDRGLWYQPPPRNDGTEQEPVWVCSSFRILARTSDESHYDHGVLLEWPDHDGERHIWAMPKRMVHADGNAIAAQLEDAGLSCGTSRAQHDLLKRFLGAVCIERRVCCVDRSGWHGAAFVMPDGRVLGADVGSVVLQTEYVVKTGRYAERGSLNEWRDNIARYAVGNHVLTLTMSGAFVAPLLDILGEPSRGGNLSGQSQTGKTTLVRCALSVYGPAEEAYIRTWRATANGLEATAAETNHLLMTLDELGQANPSEAGSVVYMLGNSAGKQRANRAGGARQPHNWLTFFWSTGETTLAAKLAEAGQRARAGMDVRMVEVSADAGSGMGVWQDLFGFPSGAALTNHLRAASRMYCGTAGPAFLDRLARDRADNPAALMETLRKPRQKFLDDLLPEGADGQVQSVAAFFALIGAAGELAAAYGVLPWQKGQALRSAVWSFQRWLAARGGAGAGEHMRALEQVRAFIAAHGASRFEVIDDDDNNDDDDDGPKEQRVINRAGFKLIEGGVCEYLILPDAWRKDVCAGLDPTQAAKALKQEDLLIPDADGRHLSAVRRCGMYGPIRGYCIRGQILGDDEIPGDDQ